MYDTVRLAVGEIEIDPARLLRRAKSGRYAWQETVTRNVDAEGVQTETSKLRLEYSDKAQDRIPHFLTYAPKSGTLIAEVSLPKVLYGQNVSMLAPGDVAPALDKLSNCIADLTGADIPHCGDWGLRGRADAVYSWDVGDQVNDYLRAAKQMRLARHRVDVADRDKTIYWKSKQRLIRAYDKFAETRLPEARGILRFEVEMKRAKADLKRIAGATDNPKARDVLNWPTARAVISYWLGQLGTDLVITDSQLLVTRLLAVYKPPKAKRLLGHATMLQIMSRDELLSSGLERTSIWRDEREIKRAGANVATTESGLLPALRLPDRYDGSPGKPG